MSAKRTVKEIQAEINQVVEKRDNAEQFTTEYFQAVAEIDELMNEKSIAKRREEKSMPSESQMAHMNHAFDNDFDF